MRFPSDDERSDLAVLLAVHEDLERRLLRMLERRANESRRGALQDAIDRTDVLLRKVDARIRLAAERVAIRAPDSAPYTD